MSTFTLIHHVYDGEVSEWKQVPATNAPPLTEIGEWALGKSVMGWSIGNEIESTRWWHHDPKTWDAVTELRESGRDSDAEALAVLLRWCEARAPARVISHWELVPGAKGAGNSADAQGKRMV